MSYFSSFQKIEYDVDGTGKYNLLTNLTINIKFKDYITSNLVNFDRYDVVLGETPESIAFYYYEDVRLYWLILLANNIINYHKDWPMTIPRFESYVNSKYTDPNAAHHYEIEEKYGENKVIKISNNVGYPNAAIVTNYDYELSLQKEESKIKLIMPEYSEQIVREFDKLVKG